LFVLPFWTIRIIATNEGVMDDYNMVRKRFFDTIANVEKRVGRRAALIITVPSVVRPSGTVCMEAPVA
jgi:hypothetical protein